MRTALNCRTPSWWSPTIHTHTVGDPEVKKCSETTLCNVVESNRAFLYEEGRVTKEQTLGVGTQG